MSFSQGFTKLSAEPIFDSREFYQVDQLADILFSDFEQLIQLEAEHEAIIACWIISSLKNSRLVKKVNLPITIHPFAIEEYQALSVETQSSLMSRQHTWLYLNNGVLVRASKQNQIKLNKLSSFVPEFFSDLQKMTFPELSLEYQCRVLKFLLSNIYHATQINIPKHTIERALEWQGLYGKRQEVFDKTIKLIRRAVNRLLVTQTDVGQVVLLEPHHVAEVLSDWEQINLSELLRPGDDNDGMSQYLNGYVVAQQKAIDKILGQRNEKNVFILVGPRYSGRRTFAKSYARFINGHQRFCVEIDFRLLDGNQSWHETFVKSPATNSRAYLSLLELISQFPKTVLLLTNIETSSELHQFYLKAFMRCAQLGVGVVESFVVDFSQATWLLILNTPLKISKSPCESKAINSNQNIDNVGDAEAENMSSESAIELSQMVESHSGIEDDFDLAGLEEILYQKTEAEKTEEETSKAKHDEKILIEEIYSSLPSIMPEISSVVIFDKLNDEAKRIIIAKALKSMVRRLRMQWKFPLYFQEEVITYLFGLVNASDDGLIKLSKFLQEKVCAVFQHAAKTREITDKQAFMLQLNETGLLLTAVVVDQPSVLQNQRALNFEGE